jgi:DNA-binding transcriptional regulator GbsR (MarR family)
MRAADSQFIEKMGIILETEGFPRVAGRVVGLLLLEEDALCLDAIAKALGVSKASISINARMLEQRGAVERISQPGDRRDHYRIARDLPLRTLEARLARLERLCDAIAFGQRTLTLRSKAIAERFDDLDASYGTIRDVTSRTLRDLARRRAQSARAKPNRS